MNCGQGGKNMNPPMPMNPSMPMCSQCGKFHPPLAPGKECPMAVVRSGGNIIDFEKLFIPSKTICKSQIQKKGIKDINKLFGYVIVQLTKLLEGYNESS